MYMIICCTDLLKFSLMTEKRFSGNCITAVSPAALLMGQRGETTLRVVCALWLVQNPQEQKPSELVTLKK